MAQESSKKKIEDKSGVIEDAEITSELERSYIDYAMSVIVARALPDVRDGLKPVHRRILWAMWDSGLTHTAKYRKSANVVGEVLGKYHPHGDSSVYDAIVRMAQDFSLRYPLIDGQGNWGSIDGDNAAAMRYTECRLTKIAQELLTDIEKGTVDFAPNYDDSKIEPLVLPAKIPHMLINGGVGIAVGMATDIPPHNLTEIIDATLHVIRNDSVTTADLMEYVQGPDFPTGGIIYDRKSIIKAYETGQGAITCRAKADIIERKAGTFSIAISEIPYRVNKSQLILKIAQLVNDKKITGIKDIRDESDKEGLSIVIDLKNDAVPQKVLNQLYKYTELQKDSHLNMIGLVEGIQPQQLSLKDILEQYVEHRQIVVRRRTEFDLGKAKERAHILEGLVVALDHIDEVIATIKKSKDKEEAHVNLMKKFKLTDVQATAILEMRLQTLASLERKKIEDELDEKKKLIKELETILSSEKNILNVIETELEEMKEAYGDDRRTRVVKSGLGEFQEEDFVTNEEVIITLSSGGYIKRSRPDIFRTQHRGGKGLSGSTVKEDDFLTHIISAETHDNILFFTDTGKVFQTKVYEVPEGSRIAKGKVVQQFLDIPSQETVRAIVAYSEKNSEYKYLVMATNKGVIKKTSLDEFANVRRNGIIAVKLKKGDYLRWVRPAVEKGFVMLATKKGQAIQFPLKDLRAMGRNATGVKGITLGKDDEVVGLSVFSKEKADDKQSHILVVMEKGFAKQTPLKEYRAQSRGGKGIKTAKVTDKTGNVAALSLIIEDTELMVLSQKGQVIKTALSDIRKSSRATSGVKVMRVDSGDKIVSMTCL